LEIWRRAEEERRGRQMTYSRIVCLTEETVETLYLLGQDHRIVGVTGYAVRPARVRREKPRVGAFTSADVPKILALNPDLVLTFSDLQAPIAADLIREGVEVHAFNQRDVAGILRMIRTCGHLTGAVEAAETLAAGYEERLADIAATPRPTARACCSRSGMNRSFPASAGSRNSSASRGERMPFPNSLPAKPPRTASFCPNR
jgi:ABC-type hemin transport system substrate-binding protein